jgi:hypothetical protein
LLLAGTVSALSPSRFAHPRIYADHIEGASNFVEANFTQLIDHFATPADTRTFNQRYFYNDTFWDQQTGPVFLFICGEGRCNPPTSRGYPL